MVGSTGDIEEASHSGYGTIEWSQANNSRYQHTSIYHHQSAHSLNSDTTLVDEHTFHLHEPTNQVDLKSSPFCIDTRKHKQQINCYSTTTTTSDHHFFCYRFRYVVAFLLLFGTAIGTYANYTLFIMSIEMISNDVLTSGLTGLRAKHMAHDPLSEETNAAAPGTCPVETVHSFNLLSVGQNATELSEREHVAMALDAIALFADVNTRLASGNLVDWTINQRGILFTAHTLGSLILAVPMSRLALIYGSKLMVTIGLISGALRMLLLPLVAGHAPFWFMLLFELVMGALGFGVGSVIYPLAAAWLLPHEASAFFALFQMAGTVGAALTNVISTQMLAHHQDWCWGFYLPGFVLGAISAAWLIFGADKPEKSRFVSPHELALLQEGSVANCGLSRQIDLVSLGGTQCMCDDDDRKIADSQMANKSRFQQKRPANFCPAKNIVRDPDWSIILRCPTVWALVAVKFAYHWNTKMATLWPTYFANILHLDAASIGLVIGLKGVVSIIYGCLFAYATRKLASDRPFNVSLTAYRRACQVFATLALGVSLMLMTLFDCDLTLNIISVMLMPIVIGFNVISFIQLPLDLSPEDSGLLTSYIHMINLGDIVALPASSYVLSFASNSVSGDRPTWRIVWLLGLGMKALACLLFVVFARAEPKSYSRVKPSGPCKSRQPLIRHHNKQPAAG